MKPEIKSLLEKAFLQAYKEAESVPEADSLFWAASDLGIELTVSDEYKKAVDEFFANIYKICSPI